MEPKEVKIYYEREKQKYLDLLEDRQKLRTQIEIEEQIVSDIPNTHKELIKLVEELRRANLKIRLLEEEKNATEPDKNTEEIRAFKDRLNREYQELLASRQRVLAQQQIDQDELEKLLNQRRLIITDISKSIKQADQQIKDLKKEKEDFIVETEEKRKEAENQLKQIEEEKGKLVAKEKELSVKSKDTEQLRDKYLEETVVLEEKKLKIKNDEESADMKKAQINWQIFILDKKVKHLDKLRVELEKKNIDEKNKIKELDLKKVKLEQEAEVVSRKEQFLKEEAERIQKDREHLYSQQASLRSAFDEARQRRITP